MVAIPAKQLGSIPESQVTGLVSDLAGKAASVHVHAAADTTSGVFAPVLIPVQQGVALVSGQYYWPCSAGSSSANDVSMTAGSMRAIPWIVPHAVTIVRLGICIDAAGTAGNVVRLGIYSDSGAGYPGAKLLDAGTVAASATGSPEITISQALTAGSIVWLVAVAQTATGTAPQFRATGTWHPPIPIQLGTTAPTAGKNSHGYSQASVTGALPSTFSATVSAVATAFKMFVKIS